MEAELGQAETKIAATGARDSRAAAIDGQEDAGTPRAERESANSGAALRQMEGELRGSSGGCRSGRWAERNRDAQNQRREAIERKQQESAAFEAEREGLEAQLAEIQERLDGLRAEREAAAAGGGGGFGRTGGTGRAPAECGSEL